VKTAATLGIVESDTFLELLAEARAGRPEALDALMAAFYPVVQRMVHKSLARDLRVHRPWLTARFSTGDIVQEVFRSVLKDLGAFAGTTEAAFLGYLTMVVRNRLIDAIRFHESERRDGRRTGSVSGTWGPARTPDDPEQHVATAEELERMHRALARFPERERLLLRARFEGVETFKNLGEQLGYGSETATRRAFYAAQARLAILLGER
jgi:RNA polymerase sigma factor (sigma-70 family)